MKTLLVEQPDGSLAAYGRRRLIPLPAERAAWEVVSPEGKAYRVRLHRTGSWG